MAATRFPRRSGPGSLRTAELRGSGLNVRSADLYLLSGNAAAGGEDGNFGFDARLGRLDLPADLFFLAGPKPPEVDLLLHADELELFLGE